MEQFLSQFLCYATFWKSFQSGWDKFSSDTDPAAAAAAAASAAASIFTTTLVVVASEAAAPQVYMSIQFSTMGVVTKEAEAAPAAAMSLSSSICIRLRGKNFCFPLLRPP